MIPNEIFSNQTADGNSLHFTIDKVNSNKKVDPFIGIRGTFGSATVKLQWLIPGGDPASDLNWADVDAANDSWTSDVQFPVFMNIWSTYRLNLSGAGGTVISAWVFGGSLT